VKGAATAFLLCALAPARAESGWAYVPASRDAHRSGVLDAPWIPSDDVVRLVGAHGAIAPAAAGPRPVVAVDLSVSQDAGAGGKPAAAPAADEVPANAHWPDASGRIEAAAPEPGDPRQKAGIRNPWEVRVRPKAGGNDAVFLYAGIIAGGEGGPLAFVNGRGLRTGDTLGKFTVARIAPATVLLERSGSYFVLPRSRRTTVGSAGE